jgi:hypothetical protein
VEEARRGHRRWRSLDAYLVVDASGTFSETKRRSVSLLKYQSFPDGERTGSNRPFAAL